MRSDQENLDLFRVYLDEVGRHPLLTKEDEIELEATADHGEWARRKMIESNHREEWTSVVVGAIAVVLGRFSLPAVNRTRRQPILP